MEPHVQILSIHINVNVQWAMKVTGVRPECLLAQVLHVSMEPPVLIDRILQITSASVQLVMKVTDVRLTLITVHQSHV